MLTTVVDEALYKLAQEARCACSCNALEKFPAATKADKDAAIERANWEALKPTDPAEVSGNVTVK